MEIWVSYMLRILSGNFKLLCKIINTIYRMIQIIGWIIIKVMQTILDFPIYTSSMERNRTKSILYDNMVILLEDRFFAFTNFKKWHGVKRKILYLESCVNNEYQFNILILKEHFNSVKINGVLEYDYMLK